MAKQDFGACFKRRGWSVKWLMQADTDARTAAIDVYVTVPRELFATGNYTPAELRRIAAMLLDAASLLEAEPAAAESEVGHG